MMETAKSGLAPAVAAPPNNFVESNGDMSIAASSGYAGASSGYGGHGGYYGKCVYCCDDDDDDDLNEALAALAGLAGAAALLAAVLNFTGIGRRSFPETFLFDYYDYTIPGNKT